jgi:hypothetical protein
MKGDGSWSLSLSKLAFIALPVAAPPREKATDVTGDRIQAAQPRDSLYTHRF